MNNQSGQDKKPEISVIMPVYNTEEYVWEAIESILQQSFSNFEFIIVDDASIDSSYQICEAYAKKDMRIRLYRNEKNMWISYTRNRLIELSRTNYIASQDSDDISIKTRLELSYDFLKNNANYAVVSWNNLIINDESNIIWKREYSNDIRKNILKKSPISQPASMFRKDIFFEVGWYDKNLNYGEDYDLWLKIFSKGYRIKNIQTDFIKYRIRAGQTKSEKIKETLINTLYIQKRAIYEYSLKPKTSDKIYYFLEKVLLFFPKGVILWLFKRNNYSRYEN